MTRTASGLEELTSAECYALIATRTIGRLGVVIERYPEVLPVNYVLDRHVILFRSHAGPKLDAAHRANVTFEVDAVDIERRTAWSVLVRGLAEVVEPGDTPARAARIAGDGPRPWAPGDKPYLVRIIPHRVTGRRLRADHDVDLVVDIRGYL